MKDLFKFNLRLFDEGTGGDDGGSNGDGGDDNGSTNANNNRGVRQYQMEFKQLLQAVYGNRSYFGDFFGGGIEVRDGVQHNETAFYVKTSDIPVVVGDEYDTDEDVAFGEGTGSTTRFGERTEIIYTDTPVNYTWVWTIHEGIDRHTVNNDFNSAVMDRLELQAQAKTTAFNNHHGEFISDVAGKEIIGGTSITKDNVGTVFNELAKYFTNIGAIGTKAAKVTADVFNAIVDSGVATTAKGSTVNIDRNEVVMFKGFVIEEIPESLFQEDEVVYAYIVGVGKAFTGINTARTIESEDFDGVALQGAGKAGEFILDDNKKAVAKVVLGEVAGGSDGPGGA